MLEQGHSQRECGCGQCHAGAGVSLKVLWPLDEATLEQVQLRALWLWMNLCHTRYIPVETVTHG